MNFPAFTLSISALFLAATYLPMQAADLIQTEAGTVEGVAQDGIRIFKGIPYAAPPVGELRWQAPRPALPWEGVRKADQFGAHPMQAASYGDMIFRDAGPSEDCLTLNVWTPAGDPEAKLPVMVWIYGGGFGAGGTSEARQDGANLARKGVIVVSMNYRLGVFGFFSHPELTAESGQGASGNYGLLDQVAALRWVRRNIAAFGGDPERVTIFGESAGSFSVSALMASPLSRDLVNGAIGESGAFFSNTLATHPRAEAEQAGVKFAGRLGAASLAALRSRSTDEIQLAALAKDAPHFGPIVDGWYLPKPVVEIYQAGEQAHIPLLAGWNADEHSTPASSHATAASFAEQARQQFGEAAARFLEVYPAATDPEARVAATAYDGDRFIGFGTWKWLEMQTRTGGGRPVYRYRFDHAFPQPAGSPSRGAYHAGEIEYAFGNLASKDLPFTPDDQRLSEQMSTYWTNFAKTGDPNGQGLPEWPGYGEKTGYATLHLDVAPKAAADDHRARYLFLDTHSPAPEASK